MERQAGFDAAYNDLITWLSDLRLRCAKSAERKILLDGEG